MCYSSNYSSSSFCFVLSIHTSVVHVVDPYVYGDPYVGTVMSMKIVFTWHYYLCWNYALYLQHRCYLLPLFRFLVSVLLSLPRKYIIFQQQFYDPFLNVFILRQVLLLLFENAVVVLPLLSCAVSCRDLTPAVQYGTIPTCALQALLLLLRLRSQRPSSFCMLATILESCFLWICNNYS